MARPVPADLEDALAANPAARAAFGAMPAEQKDAWVAWVERARLPRARRRRVADAVRRLAGPAAVRETAVEGPAPVPLPRDNWWVWLLGLLLLAGVAALIVWLAVYRHHDSKPSTVVVTAKATVPGVVGIRVQSAQFQLQQAKLASKVVHKAATKPKGIVLDQAPKAHATVPQGTKVTLVVSNGPPGVAMPDVVGLAAADAVNALQARKLTPTLQQKPSQEAPGTVLAQSPKPGARAKPGTTVVLQVAKGNAAVSVPNVVGQPQSQAVSALQQAGLKATTAQVPSSQSKGTVVAQNPAGGQKVSKGSAVRVNVSKGQPAPSPTTTAASTTTTTTSTSPSPPSSGNDYTGMRLQQAIQKITQGRQEAIVVYVSSAQPAGVVVANSKAGSRERLQVSAGSNPQPATNVPDVTGEDAATAQQDLQTAGFTVIQAKWPVSDSTQDGQVVYETPAGGQQAPKGSAIVIYVGTANA
ncbi:MAG: eukaryotic-like serine/threonine-protein kinase [Gaiellaceae bacterium]|nr:eukaryotic-like serine/threonine-protein kinase [Gaiellaceae bacterium]